MFRYVIVGECMCVKACLCYRCVSVCIGVYSKYVRVGDYCCLCEYVSN